MKRRSIFICSALFLTLCATGTYADGTYQRTKDRKTLVWNTFPKRGETVTWSGDRDADGYATGPGTLTWYTVERSKLTGFNLPFSKYKIETRYSGQMVRGKLNGMTLKVDADGNTFHGRFVEGRKTGKWAAGPAPSASPAESTQLANQTSMAPDQRRDEQVRPEVAAASQPEPPAPAEGPSSVPREKATQPVAAPAVTEKPNQGFDDSLKSLVGPPSLLRTNGGAKPPSPQTTASHGASPKASTPPTVSSSPAGPRLTADQVIALANAEARAQGYDLGEYQRPQADYTAADDNWSVLYDQKNADGSGKRFSVSVADKTKKASIADR